MAKKVSVSINLQGNYLAVIKKAQRYTSAFDKDVKKMTADLDKARKKKVDIAIKDSKARKVISSLEKKLAPMRNVMVKVAANVAHFNDPNGILRQALSALGISLPTISNGGNGGNGGKTGGPGANQQGSIWNPNFGNQNTPAGGKTLTAQDAIAGFLALKGASWLTKAITGRGLIANGGKLLWNTAKVAAPAAVEAGKLGAAAVNNAAVVAAGASPVANAAMVGGTAALSSILPGLPMMTGWLNDRVNIASFDLYQKTGKNYDTSTPKGWLDSFSYMNTEFNNQIDKNVDDWGTKFSAFMDNLLGIKRQPNGLPDLKAMWGTKDGAKPGYPSVQMMDAMSGAQDSFNGVSGSAQGAASNVTALKKAIDSLSSSKIGPVPGPAPAPTPKPKAVGIKRVPRDNYPALLHKGEAVLPSGEAGEYRGKGNSSGQSSKVFNVNITVNGAGLDENRLASIFVGKLQEAALNMA